MVTATKAAEHHRTDSQIIVNRCPARPIGTQGCEWCNGLSKAGLLYRFKSQRGLHRGLFCSKSCHDAQHGESRERCEALTDC